MHAFSQGILPANEEERQMINQLGNAHSNLVLENPDERLCEEVVNPPPIDFDLLLFNITSPTTSPTPTEPPECARPDNTDPTPCGMSMILQYCSTHI